MISAKADALPSVNAAASAEWSAIEGDGVDRQLALDHEEILAAAVNRLRSKTEYTSLPSYLLPAEFTLSELQRAYRNCSRAERGEERLQDSNSLCRFGRPT